jgi:hypothetical protein
MTNPGWTYRLSRIAAAGLLGFALAGGASSGAFANEQDDDEAFDTKIIRQFLHGLGLRRGETGIDYRERSPLVVPPQLNLPSPETGSVTEKTAAWPVDPDVKRAKEMRAARKKPRKDIETEESRPELPDQLGPRAARVPAGQRPTAEPYKDPTVPSTAGELKTKNIFTLDNLWGKDRRETATFTAEPPRTSLTEPPVGYRTPAAGHTYGLGPYKPEAINPMDTSQMRGTN